MQKLKLKHRLWPFETTFEAELLSPMSRQNSTQQRTLNVDMSLGSPVLVRRSHLMRSTATSPQVFCKVTRSTYAEMPKALKSHILQLTETQLKKMKRELGPDLTSLHPGGDPTQPSSAGGSQDEVVTRSPKQPKRANNWSKNKSPTPEGLRHEERDGSRSSPRFIRGHAAQVQRQSQGSLLSVAESLRCGAQAVSTRIQQRKAHHAADARIAVQRCASTRVP